MELGKNIATLKKENLATPEKKGGGGELESKALRKLKGGGRQSRPIRTAK